MRRTTTPPSVAVQCQSSWNSELLARSWAGSIDGLIRRHIQKPLAFELPEIHRDLTRLHLVGFHLLVDVFMVVRHTRFECGGVLLEIEDGGSKDPFSVLARSGLDAHHHAM